MKSEDYLQNGASSKTQLRTFCSFTNGTSFYRIPNTISLSIFKNLILKHNRTHFVHSQMQQASRRIQKYTISLSIYINILLLKCKSKYFVHLQMKQVSHRVQEHRKLVIKPGFF